MSTPAQDMAVNQNPLESVEVWDDHVRARYQQDRKKEEFRIFDESSPEGVKEFYRLNHAHQTREFARAKRAHYEQRDKMTMGIWQALEKLNTLVDDSDPDTDLSQIEHCLQTAESIRADGHPDWMVLTGLVHDLGKLLVVHQEPQWAVVGDTFPVGCAYSDTIVFHNYFEANPDSRNPAYNTLHGVYEAGCGLRNVDLSWGHDEYMYHVTKDYLPEPALYMLRYHSFYPWHREGAYEHLMDDHDREMLPWVQKFNPYDLYSKSDTKPSVTELKPYYTELIAKYFPSEVRW